MSWIAIEIEEVYIPPGKITVGTSNVLTQKANGEFPLFNATGVDFFTTYRLWSFNETINENIDQYVSGLWVQRTDKKESGIYAGKKCQEMYDPEMQSPQFTSQIIGQWCPDMKGNPIQFQ